jgi:hypothetical protein
MSARSSIVDMLAGVSAFAQPARPATHRTLRESGPQSNEDPRQIGGQGNRRLHTGIPSTMGADASGHFGRVHLGTGIPVQAPPAPINGVVWAAFGFKRKIR